VSTASTNLRSPLDGGLFPVSEFSSRAEDGREELVTTTGPGDTFVRLRGRRPGQLVPDPPEDLGPAHASGGRPPANQVPPGATRVPGADLPDRSWPPKREPITHAERSAVREAFRPGEFNRLLAELEGDVLPALPEELVALRAYQLDLDGYDAAAAAGDPYARAIMRAAAAAYRTLGMEPAVEELADGRRQIVLGGPGEPVPALELRPARSLLEEIPAEGLPFDPYVHECVQLGDDEGLPDGHVKEVVQKGYTFRKRVLRPARVAVVKHKTTGPEGDQDG